MKRYIYLISPQKINQPKFYKDHSNVLKTNKVKYFQLRLKKISTPNLLKISKKIKKIVKKNNVKFIINDKPFVAKKVGADGCHIGQKDMDYASARKILGKNKINDTNFLMSFSYGRALQQSALKNWAKNIKDTNTTQKIFNHRSKMNGLSTSAKWNMDLEKQINA